MKFGGVLEYSKSDYLKYIPEKLLPKTKIIHKNDSINKIKKVILKEKFEFPIFIKPDSRQRGVEIEKINDINALDHFLKTASRSEFLIKEFIDYPQELGILIAKSPDDKSKKITSVTLKKFLTVVGGGQSTLKKLISNNIRAITIKKEFFTTLAESIDDVLEDGKELILEPIGNHNLGTEFIDANHLICNDLLKVIDDIVSNILVFFT